MNNEILELVERLTRMTNLQKEVNDVISEKQARQPQVDDYLMAYNCELYEALNEMKVWKWWKHSYELDRENILDEVADCFAFILCYFLVIPEEERHNAIESFSKRFFNLREQLKTNQTEENLTDDDMVVSLIRIIGSASELQGEDHVSTLDSFVLLLIITEYLLDDINWDVFEEYYNKKSGVNVDRQKQNY